MTEQTTIAPEQEERPSTKKRGGWFVTDQELIEIMGVPEKIARDALHFLDRDNGKTSGFPQKSAIYGGRRYLPAVKAYFDTTLGFKIEASQPRRIVSVR
jgi:hypothetical protein